MGTNYYWYPTRPCPHCGARPDGVHIGKSSAGWAFSMHVLWDAPADLDGWLDRFYMEGSCILDEYGKEVSPGTMLDIIQNRPANCLRHTPNGTWQVYQGKGPWDYIIGEFS